MLRGVSDQSGWQSNADGDRSDAEDEWQTHVVKFMSSGDESSHIAGDPIDKLGEHRPAEFPAVSSRAGHHSGRESVSTGKTSTLLSGTVNLQCRSKATVSPAATIGSHYRR